MNALQQDTIAKLGFDPGEYEFSADDITFILAFREVVNEKPEFVAACAYLQYADTPRGQTPSTGHAPVAPLCVIGSVIYALKPVVQTLVDLSGWEGEAGSTVLGQVSSLSLTARVVFAADRAQFEQDNGATWGEVLEQFELRIRGRES